MTPAMAAALASGRFACTILFQLDLPSGTRRLMLGAGETKWGANVFKAYDATIGHVDTGEEISEDVTGEAPNTGITIIPSPTATRSNIAGASIQLSGAQIWLAVLQLDVNQHVAVIDDPEPLFDGFVDQAVINLDRNRDEIDYTLLSSLDYFFEDNEGQRLNGAFHRSMYPGELGLENITGVPKKIYWGGPSPPIAQSGNSGSIYGAGPGGGSVTGGFQGRLDYNTFQ